MSPVQPQTSAAFLGHSVPIAARKTRATAKGGSKKCPSYKRLPKEFQRGGFDYRQVVRQGNAAIYEQVWNGCQSPAIGYEVVRIRVRSGFEIDGRFVEPAEIYPRSEAWGADGYTLAKKDAAFRTFQQVAGRKAVQ